jgi:hypothetical protein
VRDQSERPERETRARDQSERPERETRARDQSERPERETRARDQSERPERETRVRPEPVRPEPVRPEPMRPQRMRNQSLSNDVSTSVPSLEKIRDVNSIRGCYVLFSHLFCENHGFLVNIYLSTWRKFNCQNTCTQGLSLRSLYTI